MSKSIYIKDPLSTLAGIDIPEGAMRQRSMGQFNQHGNIKRIIPKVDPPKKIVSKPSIKASTGAWEFGQ